MGKDTSIQSVQMQAAMPSMMPTLGAGVPKELSEMPSLAPKDSNSSFASHLTGSGKAQADTKGDHQAQTQGTQTTDKQGQSASGSQDSSSKEVVQRDAAKGSDGSGQKVRSSDSGNSSEQTAKQTESSQGSEQDSQESTDQFRDLDEGREIKVTDGVATALSVAQMEGQEFDANSATVSGNLTTKQLQSQGQEADTQDQNYQLFKNQEGGGASKGEVSDLESSNSDSKLVQDVTKSINEAGSGDQVAVKVSVDKSSEATSGLVKTDLGSMLHLQAVQDESQIDQGMSITAAALSKQQAQQMMTQEAKAGDSQILSVGAADNSHKQEGTQSKSDMNGQEQQARSSKTSEQKHEVIGSKHRMSFEVNQGQDTIKGRVQINPATNDLKATIIVPASKDTTGSAEELDRIFADTRYNTDKQSFDFQRQDGSQTQEQAKKSKVASTIMSSDFGDDLSKTEYAMPPVGVSAKFLQPQLGGQSINMSV